MGSRILGLGYSHPSQVVTNEDLTAYFTTSDEWIKSRTGISSRYWATDDTSLSLAVKASELAISQAGIDPQMIDLIIFATITPDQLVPSNACRLKAALHIENDHVMAFDLNAACSGFLYAYECADALLKTHNYALVVGSEVMSKMLDKSDRGTSILFGDGAGAMVLQTNDLSPIFNSYSRSDEAGNLITSPLWQQTDSKLSMVGSEVFRFATEVMVSAIEECLQVNHCQIADVDWIVVHQANIRIISYAASKLMIPMEKFYLNLGEFGNTSAASIPLALAMMEKQQLLQTGHKLLLVAFGAGMTWSSTLVTR
jgi:3-oxoacyl-[acyl-carrier-protein] synthase III